MLVQRMRVRDASLRSARAEPCGWECRRQRFALLHLSF